MPDSYQPDRRLRASGALAAIAAQAVLAYMLVSGLAQEVTSEVTRRFDVLSIPLPPSPSPTPSPSPQPSVGEETAPKDDAGAPGPRGEATQVVASKPPIVLVPPPPIVTAPAAGTGNDPAQGAADEGVGIGAGGEGTGRGAGGAGGSGQGAGGSPARRIAGALRDSDYPAAAAQASGTVFIRFRVGPDGRARGCEVVRSSGSPILDETTCRLVERRFRYRPARNAAGQPIESAETTSFTWGVRTR